MANRVKYKVDSTGRHRKYEGKRTFFSGTREVGAQKRKAEVRQYEEDLTLYDQVIDLIKGVTKREHGDIKHYEKLQKEGDITERQAYRLIENSKKNFRKKRGKLEEFLENTEKIAAVVLLAIATFSLVISIVDNPSITGYSVLGISQATNTTLILNVFAFIFVLLLVYPSGDILEQFKPVRKKSRTKARRKRRK